MQSMQYNLFKTAYVIVILKCILSASSECLYELYLKPLKTQLVHVLFVL